MDENQIKRGAGPALAAHSKDGSGPTPASSAASSTVGSDDTASGSVSDTVSRISGQAREAAGRVASSVSEAAGSARESLSGQGGRAADQAAALVREQPLVVLAAVGLVGLAFGVLLGRR